MHQCASTVTTSVCVRGGQVRRRGERVHAAWSAGPPAEEAPRGAREADACRAHAQTSMAGRSTATHDRDEAATRGRVRARCRAVAFPALMLLHVPLLGRAMHKIFNVIPSNRR
jgi:hypothetical protein